MGIVNELRESLEQAVGELTDRGFQSTDPTEQREIEQQITSLNRKIQGLSKLQLLDAAATVSDQYWDEGEA